VKERDGKIMEEMEKDAKWHKGTEAMERDGKGQK
jgi:hypothetical protein